MTILKELTAQWTILQRAWTKIWENVKLKKKKYEKVFSKIQFAAWGRGNIFTKNEGRNVRLLDGLRRKEKISERTALWHLRGEWKGWCDDRHDHDETP